MNRIFFFFSLKKMQFQFWQLKYIWPVFFFQHSLLLAHLMWHTWCIWSSGCWSVCISIDVSGIIHYTHTHTILHYMCVLNIKDWTICRLNTLRNCKKFSDKKLIHQHCSTVFDARTCCGPPGAKWHQFQRKKPLDIALMQTLPSVIPSLHLTKHASHSHFACPGEYLQTSISPQSHPVRQDELPIMSLVLQ